MNITNARSANSFLFITLPPLILISVALFNLLVPFSSEYAGWPLVISLFFLGMPHGALDWYLSARKNRSESVWQMTCGFAGYFLTMVIMLAVLLLVPVLALVVFAGISCWHFGNADERDLQDNFPLDSQFLAFRKMSAVGKGTIILALPFAANPVTATESVNQLLNLLGSTASMPALQNVATLSFQFVLIGVILALPAIFFRSCIYREKAALTESLEMGSLITALILLHPLFAMGLYFLCWHSWRHWKRLVVFRSSTSNQPARNLIAALFGGHMLSLVLLVPTLLILFAVAAWRLETWNVTDLALLTIAVFIVVTPSHDWLIHQVFDSEKTAHVSKINYSTIFGVQR